MRNMEFQLWIGTYQLLNKQTEEKLHLKEDKRESCIKALRIYKNTQLKKRNIKNTSWDFEQGIY